MARKTLEEYIDGWAPGPITETDPLHPGAADLLSDILDADRPDDGTLPPLWHWAYFTRWPRQAELGDDGHPVDGHFLPPLPNRRRMWAGGMVTVDGRLRLGIETTRTASLTDVQVKHGRSGEMILASVAYDYAQDGVTLVREVQNHVYRIGDDDAARADWGTRPAAYPVSDAPWQFEVHTDPIRLFRLSAVTGNSHRIHYDRPYVENVERYPDLVVHGPLLAMQMGGLATRHERSIELARFDYRVLSPVFVGEPVLVAGRPDGNGGQAEITVVSESPAPVAAAGAAAQPAGISRTPAARTTTVHAKGTATYRHRTSGQ